MITLELDLSAFQLRAKELGGQIDQLPYALAMAMNDAAFKTRAALIEQTWPSHVTVRRPNFLRAALRVERATKRTLSVAITDVLQRGSLALHAQGGIKRGKTRLAIPEKSLGAKRTGSGVPRRLRPRNLPNSFRKGDAIFQRVGAKKKPRLKLMYVLTHSARIRRDVPFVEDFRRMMSAELSRSFPAAMAKAMATRRR